MLASTRWLPAIGVILVLCVIAVAWPWPARTRTGVGNGPAAPGNLQNALTAVQTYYSNNDHSLAGLLTGSRSVSSLESLGIGLSFTTTEASSGPHLISSHLGAGNTYVVLTSYAPGGRECYGILDVVVPQREPIDGQTAMGTYFFVVRTTPAAVATCNASNVVPSALSASGFPSP